MNNYFLKRVLLFFPVIFLTLFLTIVLGHIAGEVPAYIYEGRNAENSQYNEVEENFKKKFGLNEKLFYISIKKGRSSLLPIIYPKFEWNGKKNRFHRYVSQILNGSLGRSQFYNKPVSEIIFPPMLRTILINIISLILIFSMALISGYFLTFSENKRLKSITELSLQFLYASPSFWLAILFLWLFANQNILNIFPISGWEWNAKENIFSNSAKLSYHLILPVLSLSLGSIAYFSSLFHHRLSEEMNKNYYRSMLSKGLKGKAIRKRMLMKNSISPLLALSYSLIPGLIGGSVIIEKIFGIPGIGKLSYEAFLSRDYPVIYAITIFSAALTWINWILIDYLLTKLNPRMNHG